MKTQGGRTAVWACAAAAALAVAFAWGTDFERSRANRRSRFHDLRVTYGSDFSRLVEPRAAEVRALARSLGTPENAFLYVRDSIAFDPSVPAAPASEVLRAGRTSCLGKAVLLCSLYRALGSPAHTVRVVTGEIKTRNATIDHAWVDLEHEGDCLQQDTTLMLGTFEFDDFKDDRYTQYYVERERFCFNDASFAVVSQLNKFRRDPSPLSRADSAAD